MSLGAGFYVELPDGGPGGCTRMRPAVIECRLVQGGSPESGSFTNPSFRVLLLVAPAELAARHPGFYFDPGAFAEVEGPARMLSAAEYYAIVERVAAAVPAGEPEAGL